MSSDEDENISRLRADLIKSIRSKKSSGMGGSSSSTSSPARSNAATSTISKSMASSILDTDMDDLEALRRAALVTLKTSKDSPSIRVASMGTLAATISAEPTHHGIPFPIGSSLSNSFCPHGQFYSTPPMLTGPGSSFSQFPVPPPTYQPRFLNNSFQAFRALLRPMPPRSNLIVIQTVPPAGEQREEPSSLTSKLLLPQDRYSRRVGEGDAKKKRDDKWSRFDDSSGSSSSDSSLNNSPEASDAESDEELFSGVGSRRDSDTRQSSGTPLEENERVSDTAETSQDVEYETGVVVDEYVSDEDSKGVVLTELLESEVASHQRDVQTPIVPESRPQLPSQSDDDFLLEEPVNAIEFLDEPVDDNVMQQFMDEALAVSDSASTPESTHPLQEQQSPDLPTSKEKKKQELKSEMRAVEQQLEQIYRRKRLASSSDHGNVANGGSGSNMRGETRPRDRTRRRDDDRKHSSPRSNSRQSGSNYSTADEKEQSRRRSSGQRQLSSVVALRSGPFKKSKPNELDSSPFTADRVVEANHLDNDQRSIRTKRPRHGDDGLIARRSAVAKDDGVELQVPSVGDLRRFLETKKDRSKQDRGSKLESSASVVRPVESGTLLTVGNVPSTSVNASCDDRSGNIRRRISPPRDAVTHGKASGDQSRRHVVANGDAKEGLANQNSGGRWKDSGAARTNSSFTGTKVKLKKRLY